MSIEQYTYWSVTINNPDENDYLIIRNPNPKYIREMVWTPEEGEEGTKHIQGWVRLQRNQSLSFMKKLYPRAHLRPCKKDDYNENCHSYAQKNDETTDGNHHILLHDPMPAADTLLYQVLERAFEKLLADDQEIQKLYLLDSIYIGLSPKVTLKKLRTELIEREMVMDKSGLEKIFCSPVYEKMKSKFYPEILYRILKHKQDAEQCATISSQVEDGEGTDSDSDKESETSEVTGQDESSSDETDEEDDF